MKVKINAVMHCWTGIWVPDEMNQTRWSINHKAIEEGEGIPLLQAGDKIHLTVPSADMFIDVTKILDGDGSGRSGQNFNTTIDYNGSYRALTSGLSGAITWGIRPRGNESVLTSLDCEPTTWAIYSKLQQFLPRGGNREHALILAAHALKAANAWQPDPFADDSSSPFADDSSSVVDDDLEDSIWSDLIQP